MPTPPDPNAFPAYGTGGDHVRARQGRRAFRFAVAACVFLAFSLYMSENYLRYDLAESQYRMALTLHDDSARAVLRNVHRRGSEGSQPLKPKYVEALAAIEEDGLVLDRYAEAYALNPTSSFLILNYGCRLFSREQYKEARERFREASLQPPRNALPRYLEAAALAAGLQPGDGLDEAIAIVARANQSGDPVLIPPPLWHPSLPTSGEWYAGARQQLAHRCCAPLYRFKDIVLSRARQSLAHGTPEGADALLDTLAAMGTRVLESGGRVGNAEAVCGISLQLDALETRQQLRLAAGLQALPDFALRQKELRAALRGLQVVERTRPALVAAERSKRQRPLWLAVGTLAVLSIIHLFLFLLGRLVDRRGTTKAIAHPGYIRVVLPAGLTLMLGLYLFMSLPSIVYRQASLPIDLATMGYFGVLAGLMLLGIYPVFALPGIQSVLPGGQPDRVVVRAARRARRAAVVTLSRRYFGLLLGGFLCVLGLWSICFRLTNGVYPSQTELLVRGFDWMEQEPLARLLTQTTSTREDSPSPYSQPNR
jgi:tetratricopeptide (TPR) repeat protein